MWFEGLDGAKHTEPADVSRNASNVVFFPATEHVTELGTRGSAAPPPRRLSPPVALCHRRINYLSGRRLSEEFISQERQRCRGHGASLLNYSSSAPSFGLLAGCRPFCSANLQQGHLSASIPSLIGAKIVNKRDGPSRKGSNRQHGRCVCVYASTVRLGGSSYIVNKLTLLLAWV